MMFINLKFNIKEKVPSFITALSSISGTLTESTKKLSPAGTVLRILCSFPVLRYF